METVNITIRTDKNLKKQTEMVLDNLGINMTTAMTIFMKAVVRENGIPFELKADPFYSKANIEHIAAAVKRLEQNKFTPHERHTDV